MVLGVLIPALCLLPWQLPAGPEQAPLLIRKVQVEISSLRSFVSALSEP